MSLQAGYTQRTAKPERCFRDTLPGGGPKHRQRREGNRGWGQPAPWNDGMQALRQRREGQRIHS
jgi:hypothetical protein